MGKKRNFLFYEETVDGYVIVGDLSQVYDLVKAYLLELEDGECVDLEFKRHDMTQKEMDAAPVV